MTDNLVCWRDLPVALAPEADTYDQDGCWSGCAVNDDGWKMLVASKIEGKGGQILLYHSEDLRQWDYQGIFLGGDVRVTEPFWQGTMWECPNLMDFGERQVLFLPVQSTPTDHLYAAYFTGQKQGKRFQVEKSAIMVHGGSLYAPQVMKLADGRWLLFGWLHEGRSQQAALEAVWSGSMSLPLILDLLPGGSLSINPADELKSLRGTTWQQEEIVLSGETEHILPHAGGRTLELSAEFHADAGAEYGLRVLCSPDGEEQTRIVYKPESSQLFVERAQASLDQRADVNPATMPVPLADGEPLRLRAFVDHSILEIFVNERLCLACRVYPIRDDSEGVRLFARQGWITVTNLRIWEMDAVWPTKE